MGGGAETVSKTIDNRIVQMEFDNDQFEKGVKTSMDTLDKLDSKLQFKDTKGGVNSLTNIADSLQVLTDRFSGLGVIGLSVIQRLTNAALNKILPVLSNINATIRSMTTNMSTLMSSFAKYEQMVLNQQTIMSAVQGKINKLTDAAYTMEDVAEIINRLRWYTDETSYNLDQMVNAVGNFTASGVDLAESETMILGIANACAEAGIGAAKADLAMTGFSKAIGAGQLTLNVWNNQLKTSGLTNSEKFRQSLLDAAEAEGTLIRVNGKLMTLNQKEEVTLANMTETLTKYGWANTKVMNRVLQDYASTVNGVYQLTNGGKIDLSAKAFDSLRIAMEKQGKSLKDLGLDQEFDQASAAIRTLTEAYEELGIEVPKSLRAFRFAQEAVSWSQVLEATATAVSSSWSRTFELIFGNYEEAKKLWTDVSETMWDIFAGGGGERNEIFEIWHDRSYEDFAEGVKNAFIAVDNLTNAFRNLFRQVWSQDPDKYINKIADAFSNMTNSFTKWAEGIVDVTDGIAFLAESLYLLPEARRIKSLFGNFSSLADVGNDMDGFSKNRFLSDVNIDIFDSLLDRFGDLDTVIRHLSVFDNIRETFKGFIAIFDLGKQAVKGFFRAIEPLWDLLGRMGRYFLENTGSLGKWLQELADSARESDFFYEHFKKIVDFIAKVANPTFDFLIGMFEKLKTGLVKIKDSIASTVQGISNLLHGLSWDGSKQLELFTKALEVLKIFITSFADFVSKALKSVVDGIKKAFNVATIDEIARAIASIWSAFRWYDMANPFDAFFRMFDYERIEGVLGRIGNAFNKFAKIAQAKAISELAKALLILARALFVISIIDPDRIVAATIAMGALMAELSASIKYIQGISLGKGSMFKIGMITSLATAMLILSFALAKIASVKDEDIIKGLAGMAALFTELVIAANNLKKVKTGGIVKFAVAMLILAVAVKMFGNIDDAALGRGLLAMAAIMTELAIFFAVINNFASFKVKAAGKALLTISAGMLIFAAALKILSKIDEEKLAVGMKTMTDALIMLTIAALALGAGNTVKGASALLIMAAALLLLTPSIILLGTMKWENIGRALRVLAGSIIILGVAAALLAPVIPAMLGLAGALALLGIAMAGIGAGILLLSVGLTTLAAAISVSSAAIGAGLQVLVTGLIQAIVQGIYYFVKGVADIAEVLTDSAVRIGKIWIEALISMFPVIIDAVLTLINDLIVALTQHVPTLVDNLVKLVVKVIDALANAILEHGPELLHAIGNLLRAISIFVLDAIEAILGGIPGIKSACEKAKRELTAQMQATQAEQVGTTYGESLTDGVATGIENTQQEAVDAAGTMVEKIETKVSSATSSFASIGSNIARATGQGIYNNTSYATVAAGEMINRIIAEANRKAGIRSPSKVFMQIGKFLDEGAAIGIRRNAYQVEKSSGEMIDSAITAFRDPLNGLADLLASDIDMNPTITPVIDLSNVTAGASAINDMMANRYSIGLAGTTRSLSNSMKIQNGNTTVADAIASLKEDLYTMKNEMLGMRIVMDSGALVGSISTKMDGALGTISTYKGRGNM